MRPTFDRRHWILLFIILIQCTTYTQQQNIKPQKSNLRHAQKPAEQTTTTAATKTITTTPSATTKTTTTTAATKWSSSITSQMTNVKNSIDDVEEDEIIYRQLKVDNKYRKAQKELQHEDYINDDDDDDDDDGDGDELEVDDKQQRVKEQKCAKNCLTNAQHAIFTTTYSNNNNNNQNKNNKPFDVSIYTSAYASPYSTAKLTAIPDMPSSTEAERPIQNTQHKTHKKHTNLAKTKHTNRRQWHGGDVGGYQQYKREQMRKVHTAHRQQHREVKEQHKWKRLQTQKQHHQPHHYYHETRLRRDTVEQEQEQLREPTVAFESSQFDVSTVLSDTLETVAPSASSAKLATTASYANATGSSSNNNNNNNNKRTRSTTLGGLLTEEAIKEKEAKGEAIIIIDDVEEFDSGTGARHGSVDIMEHSVDADYSQEGPLEPRVLPLRPVLPNPYDNEEMSVVYAEQHSEIKLMCEVDLDIATSMWYKNGQVVHAIDRTTRVTDYRFIKEANGALTITNVMLEDDGKWQCEAENTRRYTENARPVKLVVLDRPKPPYLLIDSRRLDAGNIFVPVKENSELNLACVSEGGNPRPTLTWEVLLSPGVDRHAQKVSAEVLELEEVKSEKDKNSYKINSGAKSEARLPAVYRAHHNARILCVMEHPMLKIRQNASLLLDVQYTPSFAISRTPGFGYPLREGIEVSLKCDVDSNPPSTPRWQKDDGDTPVPQTGDGFLNFTSIRREHSGWYKCTSRHLNFQYSSIGYYLSVRYDSVDVTSEPDDQDVSVAAASHNPNKGQLEVQLGGAVTLQCPQGSLGCWSHLDPVTARLRGLGHGLSTPTGQVSLKDVVYQDAGTYKCIGQSPTNKKKLEVLQSVSVSVKGAPTVIARNATPVAYPGSPLHLAVEFCANPPAHAARWLHGDRVFTPGNQYGNTVLAYGVTDLPTPYCKEARLTYVSMHERVPRTFYFIVSSPGGVAEAIFKVNFTMRYRQMSNAIDDDAEEELSEPEEIHFPVFGNSAASSASSTLSNRFWLGLSVVLCYFWILRQL